MEKVNILLVDDQPAKLLSYQAILADLEENLISTNSGREALQCLLKQDVALILLDVVMPEMDGFETAKLIRQHPRLEQTPIIFVTALSTSDVDRLKGYALGAVDYVFVPVVPEILRAKVAVFVELYRKRQELQNLNRILEQRVLERQQAEAALAEERSMLAIRVEERTVALRVANAELARAARLKDEFLASMSHELRTPLNAILGLSEAMQERVYGQLTEKQQKALHNLDESAHHLLALINDILDLSKIEAGKLELAMDLIPVGPICEASLRLIKQSAHQKQIKVSSQLDPQVKIIEADERRLKEILVNLLSNAVKFTSAGGTIGLEVIGDHEKGMAHFAVWDTGIGISPENQKKLFQPFVQLDSSLARQYEGTGLGLALVHRMAKMHEGHVVVKSELGKGSRFTVSLPWNISSEAEAIIDLAEAMERSASGNSNSPALHRTSDNEKHHRESPLILLADDNESNINVLNDYLQAIGYRVRIAHSGQEALALTQEQHPGLILMDVQMPGMDGLATIRRLRANAERKAVPIIALTALAMPGDRERCLAAGATEYLSKPASLRELVQVIEKYLNPLAS